MNFFTKMKTLAKSGTIEDFDAALADLDAQERAEQATISKLKDDLGAAVVRGDEAAVARIQAEKTEAMNRLELVPIARGEIQRRKAETEAETAKRSVEDAAAMARQEEARLRKAMRAYHKAAVALIASAKEIAEASAVISQADTRFQEAGRPDLCVGNVLSEITNAVQKEAKATGRAYAVGEEWVQLPWPVEIPTRHLVVPRYYHNGQDIWEQPFRFA